jgi:hypothetical protein
MAALRIRKFDPMGMKESRITFILGKRHTGKSVLLRDILSKMPCPDFCLAMAPTEDTLRMYREFLPQSCIFDHFNQDKLERTVTLQRELVNRGKKRTVLIILDDCLYQKGVLKSTAMRSIFFNGRHDHIALVCCAQYMMDVDVSLRSNVDYVFTMRENVLTNRQKLYKYYFGQFPRFDDFDKVMSACTQDYKSLVLDGTVSTNASPTDSVLWYRASTDVPPFKLCKPIFWKWSRKYGLSEESVREAQYKQFEIERATAEAIAMNPSAPAKRGNISIVQTEDEHGNIVSSTV